MRIEQGDCLEVMRRLAAEGIKVDATVTDAPYGLRFMGRHWDHGVPGAAYWRAAKTLLRPGGHLLAFGGTRTYHRMVCGIEDAGFEIRDQVQWLYGSGFPKSRNVSKAIDNEIVDANGLMPEEERFCRWMREKSGLQRPAARRLLGSDRFLTGEIKITNTATAQNPRYARRSMVPTSEAWAKIRPILAVEVPSWVEALVKDPPKPPVTHPGEWSSGKGEGVTGTNEWQGWGTALKPACEPIVLARKPLDGTVAANVQKHGTGALNVDGCRIEASGRPAIESRSEKSLHTFGDGLNGSRAVGTTDQGRWPANVVHDGSPEVLEAFAAFGERKSSDHVRHNSDHKGNSKGQDRAHLTIGITDTGTAARFFYTAKADKTDRWGSKHPTVKPVSLIRWLVRLVTPPGGTVLDPFAGSGTCGVACIAEGFDAILIEREAEYMADIKERIAFYQGEGKHSLASKGRNAEKPCGADLPLFAEGA